MADKTTLSKRAERLEAANITYADWGLYLALCLHMKIRYQAQALESENKKQSSLYKEKLKFWVNFEQFLEHLKNSYIDQYNFIHWDEEYNFTVQSLGYRSEDSIKQNIVYLRLFKEMINKFSLQIEAEIAEAISLYKGMYEFLDEESKLFVNALERYLDNTLNYNLALLDLHKNKGVDSSNLNSTPRSF